MTKFISKADFVDTGKRSREDAEIAVRYYNQGKDDALMAKLYCKKHNRILVGKTRCLDCAK